jgi:murein L,D-transpeptidase YcbB/YkuD
MKTLFRLLFFAIITLPLQLRAQSVIANVIKQNRTQLHYPLSVERFYRQEDYRLVWVLKDTVKTPAWDAMLLLDCVLQYGLNPVDYHPQELTYELLHKVQAIKASNSDRAYFDVILTDAIITLINNLHYGQFNPDFALGKVDADDITQFKGDKVLLDALEINSLKSGIVNAQPKSEAYINLQRHLILLTTKYSGSNYVKPESDIKKIAINMEWLRWINTTGKTIPLTCIVSEGIIIHYRHIR